MAMEAAGLSYDLNEEIKKKDKRLCKQAQKESKEHCRLELGY